MGLNSTTRDSLLFLSGLVFAFHEVILRQGPERPFTLGFIGAILGLPFALRADEYLKRNGANNGGK